MAAALTLGTLGGCAPRDGARSEAEIRSAIAEYNRLLAEGYREQDMGGLASLATSNQAYTEYIHMSSLGEAGRRLESTQTALEFLQISSSANETASVETRETWRYRQVGRDGAVAIEETRVVYELTYELVREAGAWKVNWVFETADPRRPPEESVQVSGASAPRR